MVTCITLWSPYDVFQSPLIHNPNFSQHTSIIRGDDRGQHIFPMTNVAFNGSAGIQSNTSQNEELVSTLVRKERWVWPSFLIIITIDSGDNIAS